MPATALAFALAAACFHAVWNLLLARAKDTESATVVALVTAEVVFAPVAVVFWHAHASVWPYIAATGVLELAYFALLAAAYRLVPLSVVYPLARGGAPVLVLLAGIVFLGHGTSWSQVGGVALVVVGVIMVRGLGHANAQSVAFGLTIAACIAGYTLIDKHGIEHAGADHVPRAVDARAGRCLHGGDSPHQGSCGSSGSRRAGDDHGGDRHVRGLRARARGVASCFRRVGGRRS